MNRKSFLGALLCLPFLIKVKTHWFHRPVYAIRSSKWRLFSKYKHYILVRVTGRNYPVNQRLAESYLYGKHD